MELRRELAIKVEYHSSYATSVRHGQSCALEGDFAFPQLSVRR